MAGRVRLRSLSTDISMKRIFALLFVGLSAIAADTPVAVVKGTNVVFVTIADLARFSPPASTSNIVITPEAVEIVKPGFHYVGGVFYKEDGTPIANGQKAILDRAKLLNDTIADLDMALSNWDALTAAQQKAVLKRLTQVIRILLVERRNEFTVQEAQ